MFAALMAAIPVGFPVSFSIAGVGIVFAYLGWMPGVMDKLCWGRWGNYSWLGPSGGGWLHGGRADG